jgi:hypothetical protein
LGLLGWHAVPPGATSQSYHCPPFGGNPPRIASLGNLRGRPTHEWLNTPGPLPPLTLTVSRRTYAA